MRPVGWMTGTVAKQRMGSITCQVIKRVREASSFPGPDFMEPYDDAPDHRRRLAGWRKEEPLPESRAKARAARGASRRALLAAGLEAIRQTELPGARH